MWIIGRLAADRTGRLTPLQLARLLRSAATEKKAWDPVVIDVREQTSIADYFVICEGETDRQVRAIADAMMEAAKTRDRRPLAVDGYDDAGWILLDFDSVLAHVFLPGERSYYDLESLWAPAAGDGEERLALSPDRPVTSVAMEPSLGSLSYKLRVPVVDFP